MSSELAARVEELEKYKRFAESVIELAKQEDIIPKRAKVRTRVIEKTKVVFRRPRRTKAEMADAATADDLGHTGSGN